MEAVTVKTSVQMDIHSIVYHKIYGLSSTRNGFLQFVYFLEANSRPRSKKEGNPAGSSGKNLTNARFSCIIFLYADKR